MNKVEKKCIIIMKKVMEFNSGETLKNAKGDKLIMVDFDGHANIMVVTLHLVGNCNDKDIDETLTYPISLDNDDMGTFKRVTYIEEMLNALIKDYSQK